ncbi:hypothetical protein P4H27_25780 [Paenibacillus taichungensis]|uniref:hypothetical protein n=1 Tax=Paenibacillus taichungensis TaxID=484184 RepID=UPI002DB90E5A|nr:hypothetical protein [Paenibacillus taichungensis]MEC0110384.1 hypothetical protein [Paenibacillus taichungensis]MEC0200060.1 hypothetical protein [Paenibacillus taichungensis]
MIQVTYLVPSEENSKTSAGRTIVLNPFVRRTSKIPFELNFSVCLGLIFENATLDDLHMIVVDTDSEILSETDIIDVHFKDEEFFDSTTGKRIDSLMAADISLSSDEGMSINKQGIYKIQIVSNDIVIKECIFLVIDEDGEVDE